MATAAAIDDGRQPTIVKGDFRAYAKLRCGDFGEAPTRSATILLLNPSSRLSVANIGQPWDVDLRREAARLLEPPPILAVRGAGEGDASVGRAVGVTLASDCWGESECEL